MRERGAFGEDGIDALVVRFAGDVRDELQVEADAEGDGVRPVEGEEAVVVAAAAAEAAAIAGEGEAGDEDEGDLGGGDELRAGGGFADVGIPGGGGELLDMADGDELEFRADDARIAEAVTALLPQQLDVGLARERGEKGDGPGGEKGRMGGDGGGDDAGFLRAGIAEGFEADAHLAAEVGFDHGGTTRAAAGAGKRMKTLRAARRPLHSSAVPNPFPSRQPKAEIQKSAKANGARPAAAARKVGLKPKNGWQKRNFLTEVLIP